MAELSKRYLYVARCTSQSHSNAKLGRFYSDDEALAAVCALPWQEHISIARLLYLGRMVANGPDILFALLEATACFPNSWTQIVINDCIWLHSLVHKHVDLPDPATYDNRADFINWIAEFPRK